jgi:hypothetical protein
MDETTQERENFNQGAELSPSFVADDEVKKKTKPIIYTEEFVREEVTKILDEIISNKEIVLLGEVFEKKAYTRQRFSEWAEEFKNIKEISDTIKKVKDILEERVNMGGLKNKLNPTMTIFNLKNNYGWRDKTEVDQNIRMPKPLLDNVIQNNNSTKEDIEA